MAKSKKTRRKEPKVVATVLPVKEASPKKNGVLIFFLFVLVIFTSVEIFMVAQQKIKQNKRPEFIMSWPSEYKKGLTSMGEYGDFIYGVENTSTGLVYKIDKKDGSLAFLFQLPELVYSAVQDSKGDIYILDKKNTIHVFGPDNKLKKKITVDDAKTAGWIEVDSKDNFYVVDLTSSIITKYDPNFKKIFSFGGRGIGNENFTNVGKVFDGPNDQLYCVNMLDENKAQIKIFDSNGKYKKSWLIKNVKKFTFLENLAILPDGYVYLNSFADSLIYVFDNNGKFKGTFDTDIGKKFLITSPSSITGGKNGIIYVATHDLVAFKPIKY